MRGRERREIVLTMRGTEDEESNERRKEGGRRTTIRMKDLSLQP